MGSDQQGINHQMLSNTCLIKLSVDDIGNQRPKPKPRNLQKSN